jgi:hypothetical protein
VSLRPVPAQSFYAPGEHRYFNRPDGPVGDGWTDAYDTWPLAFDQAVILDDVLDATAVTDTSPAGTAWVGHTLIGRPMGFSDNAEVIIRWNIDGDAWSTAAQVSPAAFIDFNAVDPLAMGVKGVYDISLPATYMQQCFRSPTIDDVFDYGSALPDNVGGLNWFTPGTTDHWMLLRSVGGRVAFYIDGRLAIGGPSSAIPPGMVGIDMWGIEVVSIVFKPGTVFPGPVTVPSPKARIRVSEWICRPYSGLL